MRNVAIACDTVRRDRGCSGGFVNGATVGFVLLADTFDDPENARIILLSAAGLVVIGLLIAAGTVWWWRSSEIEHPALGPLEVMGSRSWWKGDYTSRRRRLEAARPEGAEPVGAPAISTSEPVDLEAAALASPREFDDLLEFPPAVPEAEAGASPPEAPPAEVVDPVADREEEHVEAHVEAHGEPHLEAASDQGLDSNGEQHDDSATDDSATDDSATDDSATDASRPIDPLLRLQHDE